MANNMTRLMVSIPQEIRNEIDTIKQREYFDKPYAELYRQLIRLGLEKMSEKQLKQATQILGGENEKL